MSPVWRIPLGGLFLSSLIGLGLGLGGYTFYYAEGASYLSDDPKACVNCHIMREHYDGWQKASHHAAATCNDCHVPTDWLPKYVSKARNGFWHSKGFTFQDFHEPIRIREENRDILIQNCVRCHSGLVGEINGVHARGKQQLDCIRCHGSVGHGPTR